MTMSVTVEREGVSLVVRISGEIARRLNVREGDQLHLMQTDYGYALSPLNEEDRLALKAAEEVMVKYDGALRKLAES